MGFVFQFFGYFLIWKFEDIIKNRRKKTQNENHKMSMSLGNLKKLIPNVGGRCHLIALVIGIVIIESILIYLT